LPHHGIEREIHVYNAVLLRQTQYAGGFFKNIDAVYVGTMKSTPDGFFTIKLPPGRYSLFTKEENGLFANLFDHDGCVNCVLVKPRKFSWSTITIDYEAAY